jgi:hypothetical protein
MSKLKVTLGGFMFLSVLLFAWSYADSRNPGTRNNSKQSGTIQKMIVENASVTMQLDLNGLNGSNSLVARPVTLQFSVAANSFFPILVFNDLLRTVQPGSMALIPSRDGGIPALPVQLSASAKQLVVEKLPSNQSFGLAVRDSKTGFTFFNVEGGDYEYNASARSLGIAGGRLLISKQFANALGRPSDAGSIIGTISVGAAMQPIEITQVVNGKRKSVVVPPLSQGASPAGTLVPGPDIIVGDLPDMVQVGSTGSQVGLGVATTSCNIGDQPVDFHALPETDHPFFPQNLYRMSGGADNTARFEQVGQAWIKHAFGADELDECNVGCDTSNCVQFSQLCPGCADPYLADENGWYDLLGSRAWVNPFTGAFPPGPSPYPSSNHTGHNHDGASHRIRVNVDDLNTTLNPGATYFAEAAYLTAQEYAWCQSHPGQCNMYNNASHRQFLVSGTTNFTFSPVGVTGRMQPAIMAWTNATISPQLQPDPGNDGVWYLGYKVTNPSTGTWHYEYAVYNYNLDRSIQSFSVPLGAGANLSNIGFHAPPQEPGWANDGTFNNQGYSSTPWLVTQASDSITWNSETFAQNQNANAIRFGTLYNFRFDADQPPQGANATVGFFKTGSPITVAIQAPAGGATPTPTATATPTATPRPTPSPRPMASPRPRPTPPPRP